MSAVRLYDEVSRALQERLPDLPRVSYQVHDDGVTIHVCDGEPVGVRARWCREVARVLPEYHCTRSRTRVHVRREPETLGPPDFVQRRRPQQPSSQRKP